MDLLADPYYAHGSLVVARWGGWLIQVAPMAYNDRVLLTGDDPHSSGYEHGWCYPKGGAAAVAVLAWDPQIQAEPGGYLKRATPGLRVAGDTYTPLAARLHML